MNENAGRKKTVRTFAAASFPDDMGSDVIDPVGPLFVTLPGADMAVPGFIDGIGDAVESAFQAVSGSTSLAG